MHLLLKNKYIALIISILCVNIVLFFGLFFYEYFTRVDVISDLKNYKNCYPIGAYKENFSDSASLSHYKPLKNGYEFSFTKSTQLLHSFAAIYIPIACLNISFTKHNKLTIKIESQKAKRIPVLLSMKYQNNLDRYLTSFIDIKKNVSSYELNIADFQTPAEWFEHNNLSFNELPPHQFQNIQTISIESCHLLPKGESDVYKITRLTFKKNIQFETYFALFLSALASIFLIIYYLKPFQSKEKIIHIPIVPLNISEKASAIDKISIFIAHNYSNPDLNLQIIQKEIGLNAQEISKEIKKKYDLTFPQYLNKVRIEEAKRILKTKKVESIAEIAYTVGFNSPNNFNRVFKNIENCTPKEYIQNINNEQIT